MNLVTIDTSPGNTAMYIGSNNATAISIGNANANVSFSGKITINNVSSNNASFINISSISGSFSDIYSSGTTKLGRTTIYEDVGTAASMTATSGSLVIKHGNIAGASSIVFPSSNSGDDFGYILYKDDKNNTTNERGRLEIGVENNFGASSGTVNDSLILNKNGGFVGIGTNDPFRTLDVSGNIGANSILCTDVGIGGMNSPSYTLDVSGNTRVSGKMIIYEATGTGTTNESGTVDSMSSTAGSLIISHGNNGGGSSIVFPSKHSSTDYGYIRYRSDRGNSGIISNERGRLEIGVEADFGAGSGGSIVDALTLNKNGGHVGVGTSTADYTLDVSGNGRFTQGLTCGPLTLNNNITLQPSSSYVEPSSNTMLGGITAGSFPDISFNSSRTIATLTIIEKGTYIIYFNFEARYSTLPTINYINFVAGTALPVPSVIIGPSAVMGTGQIAFFGSVVIAITTVGTLLLKYNITGTITSMLNRNYYAVRIA